MQHKQSKNLSAPPRGQHSEPIDTKGYIVFGTAISAEEACDLKDTSGGRVSLAIFDTTKAEAVEAWTGGVLDALGGRGLDLLVTNSTNFTLGPLEVLSPEIIRHAFDVNVFGALTVVNAFLPGLRKAHGRIVHISTWTPSVLSPFNGPSDASKAAFEALATVYHAELRPLGIDVVIALTNNLEPNGVDKSVAGKRAVEAMHRKLYGKRFGAFADTMNQMNEIDFSLSAPLPA